MSDLKQKALEYLREKRLEDGEGFHPLDRIARRVRCSQTDLYDYETDSGPLKELIDEGLVSSVYGRYFSALGHMMTNKASESVSLLIPEIKHLEDRSNQLRTLHATLFVNFVKRKTYGVQFPDEEIDVHAHTLLVKVLEALGDRIESLEKQAESISDLSHSVASAAGRLSSHYIILADEYESEDHDDPELKQRIADALLLTESVLNLHDKVTTRNP